MKRLISVVSIIIILFLFPLLTSCKCEHQYASKVTKEATCADTGEKTYTCELCGDSYIEEIPKTSSHKYTSKVIKEATCGANGEKTYTCELCGDSYTEEIPKTDDHNYTSEVTKKATTSSAGEKTYTCSVCGNTYTESIDKINSNWELGNFVDDFGDETSDAYVLGKFSGTFSNSATTGSALRVFIYLDKDKSNTTTIRLLEYESSKATFLSFDTITLKIKTPSGNTSNFELQYIGGDLYSTDSSLADAIRNNESLTCVIVASNDYRTTPDTYNFKIDNIGLSELYDKT